MLNTLKNTLNKIVFEVDKCRGEYIEAFFEGDMALADSLKRKEKFLLLKYNKLMNA